MHSREYPKRGWGVKRLITLPHTENAKAVSREPRGDGKMTKPASLPGEVLVEELERGENDE